MVSVPIEPRLEGTKGRRHRPGKEVTFTPTKFLRLQWPNSWT
jgi:hypothetical protein